MVRWLSGKRHLLKAYEFDHQDDTHTINIIQLFLNKYLFKLNTLLKAKQMSIAYLNSIYVKIQNLKST